METEHGSYVGVSGWHPKSWTQAIRALCKKAVPGLNLDTLFTTHSARRTGATLAAEGGLAMDDLCRQAGWSKADTAIYYLRKGLRGRTISLRAALR